MTSAAIASRPRTLRELPSPRGLPWLGHIFQLDPLRTHTQLEAWARELGTPYRLRLAHMPVVVFDDVALASRILRERPQRFRRGGRIRPVAAEMGFDGVFSAEGDDWAPQRRLVMAALNPGRSDEILPTIISVTERLYARWRRASDEGRVLEMTDELARYTVDVTSALALGEDPRTLEDDADPIQHHLRAIFPAFMRRVMSPVSYWRWIELPADRRLRRHLTAVHRHVRDLVARRRDALAAGPHTGPRNLLDRLIAQRDEPGSGVTDESIAANVLTLLLAGEDTTSNSLAWTFPYLAADPGLQARMHTDARARLGSACVAADAEVVRGLDAYEALVTEAQRLRPVIPLQSFEPVEDVVLGDLAIPAGTKLFFLNRPSLLDPSRYPEPMRYRPERWLGQRGVDHDPHAFLQFGQGPRVCPGRRLAGLQSRLVTSMLLRSFHVELACNVAEIEEVSAFAMTPSHMPVRLHWLGS